VPAAYGPNYQRLREIKTKYDPGNVFHLNQNILPLVQYQTKDSIERNMMMPVPRLGVAGAALLGLILQPANGFCHPSRH
jgi:hypothetical protein